MKVPQTVPKNIIFFVKFKLTVIFDHCVWRSTGMWVVSGLNISWTSFCRATHQVSGKPINTFAIQVSTPLQLMNQHLCSSSSKWSQFIPDSMFTTRAQPFSTEPTLTFVFHWNLIWKQSSLSVFTRHSFQIKLG